VAAILSTAAHASGHRHVLAVDTNPALDAALIENCSSGQIIYERNADLERHPASLTKMMTLYLVFERLKEGGLKLTSPLVVSANAAGQPIVKLYLKPGSTLTVEQAIEALIVLSANDVAVAVAEDLAPSEQDFVGLMNAKARELGMMRTFYNNPSGLPDPLQLTTATDLAILARHLVKDFPEYFHYFSLASFTFNGRTFNTHDALLGRYEGADGVKTGYTDQSGYNLVTTALRGRVHLVGVVMGGLSADRRNREMMKLLDAGFLAEGGELITVIASGHAAAEVRHFSQASR
jgi:D-alanyl-D-alanine carboxypeptidase